MMIYIVILISFRTFSSINYDRIKRTQDTEQHRALSGTYLIIVLVNLNFYWKSNISIKNDFVS